MPLRCEAAAPVKQVTREGPPDSVSRYGVRNVRSSAAWPERRQPSCKSHALNGPARGGVREGGQRRLQPTGSSAGWPRISARPAASICTVVSGCSATRTATCRNTLPISCSSERTPAYAVNSVFLPTEASQKCPARHRRLTY